jgi:hypothetical protein
MKKFTFKTIKPAGKWKSFDEDQIIVKFEKQEVGAIDSQKPHRIMLMVEKGETTNDPNPNCSWKWITLAKESESVEEAKDFLNSIADKVLSAFTLHKLNA